jgi:ABC-2 type transport system ATP-binding protein
MAEMSGLPTRAARQRAADVLYQVGLDEERYRLIKGFSTGMKQRVKLAQAIVHDPDLVFLDEPTNGLDPQGRNEMLELIIRIHHRLGITVVLSSHILSDIEHVCDHVVILNGGRLILSQAIGGPKSDTGDLLVRVEGDPEVFMQRLAQMGVRAELNEETIGLPGEMVVHRDGDQIFDAVRDAAADLGIALRSMRTRAPSLEDLYLGNVQADEEAMQAARQSNGRA